MALHVDAWTDFLCPYSYLISVSMGRLREEFNLDIRWRSYLLRPSGSPPLTRAERKETAAEHEKIVAVAREELKLELRPGPIGISSYPAHIAYQFARTHELGDAFHEAVMNAYWEGAGSIDSRELLQTIADAVGLSRQTLASAWMDPALAAAVKKDVQTAAAIGIDSVPTMVFADTERISGAFPLNDLRQMVAEIHARCGR
jgi:predicted DsbA family dithiol-disulfide isomerase